MSSNDVLSAHARFSQYRQAEDDLAHRWGEVGRSGTVDVVQLLAGCPRLNSTVEASLIVAKLLTDIDHARNLPERVLKLCNKLAVNPSVESASSASQALRDLARLTTESPYSRWLRELTMLADMAASRFGDTDAAARCAAEAFRKLTSSNETEPTPLGRKLALSVLQYLGRATGQPVHFGSKIEVWAGIMASEIDGVPEPTETEAFHDHIAKSEEAAAAAVAKAGGSTVQHDHRELMDVDDIPDFEEPSGPTHLLIRASDLVKPEKVDKHRDAARIPFYPLAGKRIPLHRCEHVDRALVIAKSFAPWAGKQLEQIFRPLARQEFTYLRPTLLVGDPGVAKTTLARAIGEALGLHVTIFNCGGVADAHFGGLSHGWSTGHESLVSRAALKAGTGNPMVVCDEVDKIGTSRHNGNLGDVLAAFLERENARRYQDPGLNCQIDLSNVSFVATANVLEDVQGFIRDRFNVVRIPAPGPEHLGDIAKIIVENLRIDRGEDERSLPDLDPQELECVTKLWDRPGRSLRTAHRVVEAWVDRRQHLGPKN